MSAFDFELVKPLLKGIIRQLENLAKEAGSLPTVGRRCPVVSLRKHVSEIHIKLINIKADLNDFVTGIRKIDPDIADIAKNEYDQLLHLTKNPSDDDLRNNFKSVLEAHLRGCIEETRRVQNALITQRIEAIIEVVNRSKREPVTKTRDPSKPMTKKLMRDTLGIENEHTFNTWAKTKDIQPAGNRQTWTIDLNKLSQKERDKIEKIEV